MLMNATKLQARLPKTRYASAAGPMIPNTRPTSQGSTIPPKLSPSRIKLLNRAVRLSDWPAKLKPVAHSGAIKKPNATTASHKTSLELGKLLSKPRNARQPKEAIQITCGGLKRTASGMDSKRPTVNESQNPEFR